MRARSGLGADGWSVWGGGAPGIASIGKGGAARGRAPPSVRRRSIACTYIHINIRQRAPTAAAAASRVTCSSGGSGRRRRRSPPAPDAPPAAAVAQPTASSRSITGGAHTLTHSHTHARTEQPPKQTVLNEIFEGAQRQQNWAISDPVVAAAAFGESAVKFRRRSREQSGTHLTIFSKVMLGLNIIMWCYKLLVKDSSN